MPEEVTTSQLNSEEVQGCVGCDFISGHSANGGICGLHKAFEEGGKPKALEELKKWPETTLPTPCPRAIFLEHVLGRLLPNRYKLDILPSAPATREACDGCGNIQKDHLGICAPTSKLYLATKSEAIGVALSVTMNLRGGCPNGKVFRQLADQKR